MPDPEIAEAVTESVEVSVPPRRRAFIPLLVVACLLLVGILTLRVFVPEPVPPPKVIAYSPQQAAEARQHLDDLSAQLTEPASAATTPDSVPSPSSPRSTLHATAASAAPTLTPKPPSIVRLQLSEADLNTYLATDKKIKPLLTARGIQAVQVSLLPPHNVVFRAAVLYQGHKTNIQIAGALLPSPDTLARLDATQAQVGSLPLPPKTVTAQADRIASQFIGHLRGRLPITVQTIQVIDDHLVLTGIRHSQASAPVAADSRRSASPDRH